MISGFATPVAREAMNGAIAARLTTDRSAYPAAATPLDVGPGKLVETHHTTASPGFVGNGDVHLAADSPLIDAGTPGSVPAGGTDRDGRARASDGNGDCAGVTDIGAFEYQGTKVRAVAAAAAPTAVARHAVTFSARGSCVPGAGAPTIRWRFDDGALAAGAAAAHAFTALGRHTATVTVTDGHGHSAQASAAVTVTARAPRISRLRVTHIGTIRFRLSKPVTVTLRVAKLGHRPHKTITVKAHTGTNRARVTAKPGRYRLTATAIGTTGLRSNRATADFTATH